MEQIVINLYYFTATIVGSYILLWFFAWGYGKSSRSSVQLERSVLRGWLLATIFHILGVVVFFVLTFLLLDFSLLIIQLVAGSICVIIDLVLMFAIISQLKSLPKF